MLEPLNKAIQACEDKLTDEEFDRLCETISASVAYAYERGVREGSKEK